MLVLVRQRYASVGGFVPAIGLGIESPDPAWGDHFQVRTLSAYDASIRGGFRYAAPFDDLD